MVRDNEQFFLLDREYRAEFAHCVPRPLKAREGDNAQQMLAAGDLRARVQRGQPFATVDECQLRVHLIPETSKMAYMILKLFSRENGISAIRSRIESVYAIQLLIQAVIEFV